MFDPKLLTFILANLVVTTTLILGIKSIIKKLNEPRASGSTLLAEALSEKNQSMDDKAESDGSGEGLSPGSFSRTAGAIGAMGLAATTIGIGYWLVYSLFYDPSPLTELNNIGWYYLSGSALFAPYAFNRLSSIFNP